MKYEIKVVSKRTILETWQVEADNQEEAQELVDGREDGEMIHEEPFGEEERELYDPVLHG